MPGGSRIGDSHLERLQRSIVAFMTLLAFGVIVTSVAKAEAPVLELLPTKAKFVFASLPGEKPLFQVLAGSGPECEKVQGAGEALSARLGVLELKYEKCKFLGIACTGLEAGEVIGNIRTTAEWHLRHVLGAGGVTLAVLLAHIHAACSILLFLILGCVASEGLLTKENGASVVNLLVASIFTRFTETGGDQSVRQVATNSSLAMEVCQPLLKESAGEKSYESMGFLLSLVITINGGGTLLVDLSGET
jgi:hypothetical protein